MDLTGGYRDHMFIYISHGNHGYGSSIILRMDLLSLLSSVCVRFPTQIKIPGRIWKAESEQVHTVGEALNI